MNDRIEIRRLGDVATLQRGFDLPSRSRTSGDFPLVSSSGIVDTHIEGLVEGPGVVTGRSGSIGNVFYIDVNFWPLNTTLYVKDFHGNEPRFIYYLLRNLDLGRFATGTGVPTLNRNCVHEKIVRVPPLPEQHRIVRILDEAFAAIATAKANTEKNLQNACAVVDSKRWFELSRDCSDWAHTSFGEQVVLQRGFDITKSQQTNGQVPVVSSGGIKSFHDTAMVHAPGVVLGRKGTLGKVFYLNTDFWPHDTTLWVKHFNGNHPRFVYHFLKNLDVKS